MKVIVTGGAGFIGSHIVRGLLEHSAVATVEIIDDLSTGHVRNVPTEARLHEISITDPDAVRDVLQDAKYVFHHAADVSVPRSLETPERTHETNATGTLNVLTAAREAGVDKLIYAGSSSAYGVDPGVPAKEEAVPAPASPYAASKLAGEHYCRTFGEISGLRTTVLRYFNVYGPGQDPGGPYAAVVPKFISRALEDAPLTIHGDGSQTRDFVHVKDVVEANLAAMRTKLSDSSVINIGSGDETSVLELAQEILKASGAKSEVEFTEARPADIERSVASVKLAKERLGWQPTIDLRTGISMTVESQGQSMATSTS